MVQTIPPDLKLNSEIRLFGQEKIFGAEDSTWLALKMTPNRSELQQAVDQITDRGLGFTPIGKALAAADEDLKGSKGNSAIIIVSDFQNDKNPNNIRPKLLMETVAKLKAEYGNRACIYPLQVAKDPIGLKIAQQINVESSCGFVENADNLKTPAAMAAYVQKIFFGPASPAPAAAARVEEKPAVPEAKPEAKPEPKPEIKPEK